MARKSDQTEPLWLNRLLAAVVFLALSLVVLAAYRGWKEDRALHEFGREYHSEIIADIEINLSGIRFQEHCLTCHPGGRAARTGKRSGPQRDHPAIPPHSMNDLGCTGCHLGEGMARDPVISHGVPGTEARKVLAGEELQASCYRCHELKPLSGAEKAWEGFRLFSAYACGTCHTVDGIEAGRYGPDLSQIGSYLGLKQIQAAVADPKAEPENSIMPKFSLSPKQIQALSYFLKSRVRDPFHETPMVRAARARRVAGPRKAKPSFSGRDLLRDRHCLACHKFQDEDGRIGPDLTYIAYQRGKDFIKNFLTVPGREIPGAIMPWIRLAPGEEELLVQFLQKGDEGRRLHLQKMRPKHLYMELCQRCHAAQGDGLGTIQPNLANFPRPFWKNAEFFRGLPDERIVRSIEKGVPGTSMPPYGELLGPAAIDSLADLIFREFVRAGRKDKRPPLPIPPRPAQFLPREKTIKEFEKRCSACHGAEGNGKGPDYLKYLPRPRNLTNHPYFQSIQDERIARSILYGVPGTGMPAFAGKISPESLWSLVKRVRELSATDGPSS